MKAGPATASFAWQSNKTIVLLYPQTLSSFYILAPEHRDRFPTTWMYVLVMKMERDNILTVYFGGTLTNRLISMEHKGQRGKRLFLGF